MTDKPYESVGMKCAKGEEGRRVERLQQKLRRNEDLERENEFLRIELCKVLRLEESTKVSDIFRHCQEEAVRSAAASGNNWRIA